MIPAFEIEVQKYWRDVIWQKGLNTQKNSVILCHDNVPYNTAITGQKCLVKKEMTAFSRSCAMQCLALDKP